MLTSCTTAAPAKGDGEELLLQARPVVGIIGRVGGLRNEDDLAGLVMLEEGRVDAGVGGVVAEFVQGRGARNVLELGVFEDSQRHFARNCTKLYKQSGSIE
jgi:hypothetical protein